MANRPAKKVKKRKVGKAKKLQESLAEATPLSQGLQKESLLGKPLVESAGKIPKGKKRRKVDGELPAESPELQKKKKKKRRAIEADAASVSMAVDTDVARGETSVENAAASAQKCSESDEVAASSSAAASTTAPAVAPAGLEPALDAEAYRAAHHIQVKAGCPPPFQSFRDAQQHMGRFLIESLREQGYKRPTPVQAQAWPILMKGEDVVAISKTGSGKTCAFLLPALVRIGKRQVGVTFNDDNVLAKPNTVVVTPTRELAQQIEVEADKFAEAVGARVVSTFGGVPKGEQLADLKRGVEILVTTPGRVLDFISGNAKKDLGPVISLKSCSYLVLDEADKMLDMGFEPDARKLVLHCMKSGTPEEALKGIRRQTLFFSATWPKTVHQLAAYFTSKHAWHIRISQNVGGALSVAQNVKQKVFVISQSEKLEKLKHILSGSLKPGETALVFAMTKKTCDFLEGELTWDPLKPNAPLCGWCKSIHGDKDQAQRDSILNTFREITANPGNRHKAVLVATDVAARGLDIPGVALVVVYDMSDGKLKATESGMEAYVHRVGRTGRAGAPGKAVSFFTQGDRGAKDLCKLLRDAEQDVPKALEDLAKHDELYGGEARGKGKGRGSARKKGGGKGKSKF